MAQKTLNAFVVIGGRVDNSFGELGTALINMGGTVDEVSQKLIDMGKKSLNVYKDYEFNMNTLKATWGTSREEFKNNERALISAMEDMENASAEWARTSIFHTNDISNAMVEAAHAGWGYNEMLEGVPAAMAMAQAGGMDLSTAMNYVVKAQKSFGWSFDETIGKIDEWIYAANKSAGMTSEFGDTFLKLGSTVRLASNTEELLALTKVMHDMGTTGSAAGTLIKTSLMKLYAPSGKANEVLQALGYSLEEIEEAGIMEDEALKKALNTLSQYGFSAFDTTTNQAKPVLQTYSELGQALIAVSGYTQEAGESQAAFYERVLKNKTVMGIMSEVFGIRGIQGSMNILMSLQEATQVYNDLTNNAAEGTTEYVREMMNDTLYGSTELFLSKVEELHRRTGEELAEDWRKIQGFVGGIVDSLNTMDDEKFSAIVGGLKTAAIAGPGLIIAGSALRFIGMLLTPAGIVGMGAVTLAAIVSSLNEIKETDLKNQFGTMNLDAGSLGEYVKTLGEDFNTAFERVNNFAGALDTAAQNYREASGTFSSDLLTAMLTKKEFTPEEKQAFEQMGIDIYEQVLASINASSDMAGEFWNTLYGGDGVSAADPRYQKILDLLNQGNAAAIEQAGSVAERLKAAMMQGFKDGFSKDDYETILKMFEEYNSLIARAQNQALTEEQFIQQEKWLHQAQTASLEDIKALAKTVTEQRDAELKEFEDRYLTERARLKYYAKESGMTDEEAERYVAEETDVDKTYGQWRGKFASNYDEFLLTLWNSQTRQSGLAGDYERLGEYADLYMSGQLTAGTVLDMLTQEMGGSTYSGSGGSDSNIRAQLGKIMGNMIASLGGEEMVASQAAYYEQTGNTGMAARMRRVLAMEQLVNGFSTILTTERPAWDFLNWQGDFKTTGNIDENTGAGAKRQAEYNKNLAMMEAMRNADYTMDMMRSTIGLMNGKGGLAGLFDAIGQYLDGGYAESLYNYNLGRTAQAEFERIYATLARTYDLDRVYSDMMARDTTGNLTAGNSAQIWLAMYDLLYGAAGKNAAQYQIQPTGPEGAASGYTIEGGADAAAEAYSEAQGALDELGNVTSGFSVTGAESATNAAHKAAQDWAATHPIAFRAQVLGSAFGGAYMADGGRATEPVVFAEAGPEWFIPEEHSPNTADLILATARASGFSLAELAERAGARMFAEGGTTGTALQWSGLPAVSSGGAGGESGGESGGGIQVHYSPVIHADNASGVAKALKEDKKRLEKWMDEWWDRREMYRSMVTYQ